MRNRHWEQLINEMEKQIDICFEKFTLHDIIRIELHKHEDKIKSIINCAIKEQEIEEKVQEIQNTWMSINLIFNKHEMRGEERGFILDSVDDIMLILDGILMTIQLMATSQ